MDVWMQWNKQKGYCASCKELLTAGEAIVRGKLWQKGHHSYWFKWHPQCWITAGLEYLEVHPYAPPKRGGSRALKLAPETQRVRFLILCRHAAAMQRRKRLVAKMPASLPRLQHLEEFMQQLKLEIEAVGGAPKSWQ